MAEFEYLNIMDVDPSFKPVDQGVYNLQLAKIAAQPITPKSGKMEGQETLMVKATFILTDDPQFSGRRFFPVFWIHNPFDQKILRKIADRTGVTQAPGESLSDWFTKLSQVQPKLKAKVDVVSEKVYPPQQDEHGQPVMQQANKIDFRTIAAV